MIAWDMSTWEAMQLDIEYRGLKTLCQPNKKLQKLIISKKISYNAMKKTCDNLEGVLPTPSTEAELVKANGDFKVRNCHRWARVGPSGGVAAARQGGAVFCPSGGGAPPKFRGGGQA